MGASGPMSYRPTSVDALVDLPLVGRSLLFSRNAAEARTILEIGSGSGETGPAGPEGPQGPQGIQGVQGDAGAQGIQGIQGDTGPAGADGAQGIQGIPGNDGAQGPQGLQGIQGIQGVQGNAGADGADGQGVPVGGTTAQVLRKASNADFDTEWSTPAAGGEAFPVGAVFIAVVSTNPGTLLGYGTWSAFGAGRVLVGLDSGDVDFDTAEETGGSKTVTLTAAESGLPQHTHIQNAHSHGLTRFPTTTGSSSGFTADTSMSGTPTAVTQVTQDATAVNQNAGPAAASQAHTNLQPYIVVYMWKRTA